MLLFLLLGLFSLFVRICYCKKERLKCPKMTIVMANKNTFRGAGYICPIAALNSYCCPDIKDQMFPFDSRYVVSYRCSIVKWNTAVYLCSTWSSDALCWRNERRHIAHWYNTMAVHALLRQGGNYPWSSALVSLS